MSLEELLANENYNYLIVHEFVVSKGLKNVTTDDLDKIIERYGTDVVGTVDFFSLYNIVSANETNRQMAKWTKVTTKCTVAVTVFTLINLILFALDIFKIFK